MSYSSAILKVPPEYFFNMSELFGSMDLPGGAVVKSPPANTGDAGSIPGPGRSHMPRSN